MVKTSAKKLKAATGASVKLKAGKRAAASFGRVAPTEFSRAKLVGKFPDVQHRPAPLAPRRLNDEDRRRLLSDMVLA